MISLLKDIRFIASFVTSIFVVGGFMATEYSDVIKDHTPMLISISVSVGLTLASTSFLYFLIVDISRNIIIGKVAGFHAHLDSIDIANVDNITLKYLMKEYDFLEKTRAKLNVNSFTEFKLNACRDMLHGK